MKDAQRLLDTLSACYGPRGNTVLVQRSSGTLWTRDGATIVREFPCTTDLGKELCRIVSEACTVTEREVGDGTSTTAILAVKMILEGLNASLEDFRAPCTLEGKEADIEDLYEVVKYATKSDPDYRIIVDAILNSGDYAHVRVQKGLQYGVVSEQHPGVVLPFRPVMRSMYGTHENCCVAVSMQPIITEDRAVKMLESVSGFDCPSVLVSPLFAGKGWKTIEMNIQALKIVAIPVLGIRSGYLRDIAAVSGAIPMDIGCNDEGFKVGWCRSVSADNESVFIAGEDNWIQSRILEISSKSEYDYDNDRRNERIASLDGGLVTLKVLGYTDSETREKMTRMEDGIQSCISAMRGGVTQSGICLIEACPDGYPALRKVLSYPHSLTNASRLEPVEVSRCALRNATSSALAFLSSYERYIRRG